MHREYKNENLKEKKKEKTAETPAKSHGPSSKQPHKIHHTFRSHMTASLLNKTSVIIVSP